MLGHFNVCVCVCFRDAKLHEGMWVFHCALMCSQLCCLLQLYTHTHKHFAVLRIQDHTLGIHFITFTGLVYIFTHDLSPWLSPAAHFLHHSNTASCPVLMGVQTSAVATQTGYSATGCDLGPRVRTRKEGKSSPRRRGNGHALMPMFHHTPLPVFPCECTS